MIEEGEKSSQPVAGLASTVRQLVNQFQAKSDAAIKERVERARKRIAEGVTHLNLLAESRKSESTLGHEDFEDILTTRMKKSLCKLGGLDSTSSEKENNICQEDGSSLSSTIIFGGSSSGTSILPPIKLPYVEKIPRYTTWIFLERNQRMAEDQSVVGRRRIYYDQCGNEALICSDSEDEIADDEENKYDFTDGDDFVLRKIIQEYGHSEAVFNALSRYIRAKPSEIETRYKFLLKQDEPNKEISEDDIPTVETEDSMPPSFFEKCLDSAMDSFDNLFCRRCLVFDCRLHGCSQDLVLPIERQPSWSNAEEERVPCGSNCYLLDLKGKAVKSTKNEHLLDPFLPVPNPYIADDALVDCSSGERPGGDVSATVEKRKRDLTVEQDSSKRNTESESINAESDFEIYGNKLRGKQTVFDSMSMKSFQQSTMEVSSSMKKKQKLITSSDTDSSAVQQNLELETSMFPKWKPLERELYLKGIEIFGKNSCLIARNLLCDLKSCSEVAKYMSENDPAVCSGAGDKAAMLSDNSRKTGGNHGTDLRRTRFWRRRGKVRRLKYSWKSAGYPSIKKRSANSKGQPCRQYIPCGCQSSCGKQCSCLRNGTCCEKYCGCSKSCKNRFRGCHCAKSQCRSRQCPCFAAGRECDPDVCRNCWVSCGDGNLGDPPQRGDNYECRNMNMLLKQQQRVLLGKSDVAGWGAFLRNPVVKHDYLGEYTGEIISHREADKRGKIYDRENSSFLFNLNNEFVLDAYRKGDKLKFANHSLNPNCYAKVIMVAGDHRVGIFAKENISGGEEIFYDYRYEQDKAPIWAKKREGSNSKKDEILSSCGRAKKIA